MPRGKFFLKPALLPNYEEKIIDGTWYYLKSETDHLSFDTPCLDHSTKDFKWYTIITS